MSRLLRAVLLVAGLMLAAHAVPAAEESAAGRDALKQLPLRRDADDGGMGWTVLAFLAALGVVSFVVSARARKGGAGGWPSAGLLGGKGTRVVVLERRSLNNACTVCLVRWDDEEVLLGCTAHSVSVISRRPAAASPAQGPA